MSDNQTVWKVLWDHAKAPPTLDDRSRSTTWSPPWRRPCRSAPTSPGARSAACWWRSLSRLPDGRQFFAREGNAVVPLSGFLKARDNSPIPSMPTLTNSEEPPARRHRWGCLGVSLTPATASPPDLWVAGAKSLSTAQPGYTPGAQESYVAELARLLRSLIG